MCMMSSSIEEFFERLEVSDWLEGCEGEQWGVVLFPGILPYGAETDKDKDKNKHGDF